jgi:hypothetical protein
MFRSLTGLKEALPNEPWISIYDSRESLRLRVNKMYAPTPLSVGEKGSREVRLLL